jgi:hypothetical protein
MGWALALVLLLPAASHAQASITGQVKDASGAILPGVTVEASSPALIEKVRSVVSDGSGQYRIEILPPGSYTVTFTLPGFSTVKREGIELTGTFTATVDVELRVGAVEETITVTGETPIVDVQSATRQRVVDRELIETLPSGRTPAAMVVLIPGVSVPAANQEVGGPAILSGAIATRIHGSTATSQLLMENGLSTAALVTPATSEFSFNMAAYQEIAVDYAGSGAENNASGVKMNLIPKEGGNTFNGTFFFNGTTGALQGDNFSERLRAAGLATPDSVRKSFDINPGFGGPVRPNKVWFYAAARYAEVARWAAGEYRDKHANDPTVWIYEPDVTAPVSNDAEVADGRLRIAWQAAPKVKIGGSFEQQNDCNCQRDISAIRAYEATPKHHHPQARQIIADITSPLTSRLLIDGAAMRKFERAIRDPLPGLNPLMINVLDQATGREYRARDSYINRVNYHYTYRASLSYITGAHALKVGVGDISGGYTERDFDNQPVSYRFNNGVPNQITMRAYPLEFSVDVGHQFGAYVQDRWTVDRLTLNAGLRYDWVTNSFPAQSIGPVPLAPLRNIDFPETSNLALHDLNPKLGAAYDLFGDGKTGVKVSLNRYVEQYTVNGIAGSRNPINRLVNIANRSWNDANRNYVPDCNLLSLDANGECGPMSNRNFGSATPDLNFDPQLLTGWGRREYNWEFSTGVQREIIPRVSADVSYFRRWYGNFSVTDNRAIAASDYDRFSITVPTNPLLPGGGGYVVTGLHDVNPARFGQSDNYITFAKNYGRQINHWNGVSVGVNARLQNNVLVQGGFDSGRTTTDNCAIAAKIPEMLFGTPSTTQILGELNNNVWTPLQFCHQESPFLTQVKLLGSYTVPKVDILASATFQSLPGPHILANYNAPNAVVSPGLGRSLSGNAANLSVTIVEPGSTYGERLNQLDLRLAKILRFGRTRATLNFDLYNALNRDTVLALNNAYAAWQRPVSIILARYAKLGVQFDF